MAAMTSAEMRFIKRREAAPRILCAGVIALDELFRVEEFPRPDGKVQSRCSRQSRLVPAASRGRRTLLKIQAADSR